MATETPVVDSPAQDKSMTDAPVAGAEGQDQTVDAAADQVDDNPFPVKIKFPNGADLEILISPLEQIHEIRQSIIENPIAMQYSCFHLEHKGKRINDFVQVSDVEALAADSILDVVEDPYTEKEARIHIIRIRELVGAAGDRTDTVQGILSGLSLYDDVLGAPSGPGQEAEAKKAAEKDVGEYDFEAQPQLSVLLPTETGPAPTTVKSIALSSWNPPPAYLRQKGHLLYLTVNTNEGKQYQITSHVGGFYVNNCSNAQFDPSPKTSQDGHAERSLYTLLEKLSPSFKESFEKLQTFTNQKDPLATFQVGNTFPAAPWLVPSTSSSLLAHRADPTRTQETYLLAGAENTDSLRDWNEEFQSAKELPRDNIPDRVFRERLIAKLFADYNDAAARGAVLVARGEVAPLNPTEDRDAQIFVYNNIFFSFGADGVGTFTSEGGDEAARVATGKDVFGVKMVNQFDIEGLYAPGTVVVDYLGKRIVGQSIVPGIFKQPEPGENQIHYGAVDGKEQVAADERFSAPFAKLAEALKVKKHSVWDKDHKRFDLEASVEMKGLLGTDGRKYVLDLYRITPLDIAWMEEGGEDSEYPHRMTILRPELVESLGKVKTREYVNAELARRGLTKSTEEDANKEASEEAKTEEPKPAEAEKPKEVKKTEEEADEESEEEESEEESSEEEDSEGEDKTKAKTKKKPEEKAEEKPEEKPEEKAQDKIDLADFKFALNPDVFSGQVPQTDEEKAEMAKDEQEVREACEYLRKTVMPGLVHDLKESEISFPMDGRSLTKLLHRRGVNMRYLGQLVELCEKEGSRLDCFRELCEREMITRSFKHFAAKYLKYLPLPLTSSCFAHLLNCFLGTGLNPKPAADVDQSLRALFGDVDLGFEKVTPEGLREDIQKETSRRFRHILQGEWWNKPRHVQLLREVALKLGLQIQARHFSFVPEKEAPATNGQTPAELKKKSKKKARDGSPASLASAGVPHTFVPDDFVNVVPLIKDSAPRSALADEAMEGGRISIYQGQRKLGEDLLLESLSLHEQIYGLLHPEVAQMYHTLSQLYYQLEQKDGAVELSRKATIVAERTMGVDSAETVLNYLNLSLFLHQRGDSQLALVYAKHAFNVWKLIYGVDHPDTITTMNNYAVMLQSIKAYHESRRWFEESLRVCELVFGRQTVNSATLLFQLSQALALDNESKEAVTRMRESFTIFRDLLGAEDKNTKEAEHWLTQLTHNAVSIARQAKEQAKLGRGAFSLSTRGVNMATAAGAAKELSGKAPSKQDQRPVEDLVKFIEGSDNKGPKKRTGRANPKQRKSTPAK